MPHIYIREEDNTSAGADAGYNIVYVPIVSDASIGSGIGPIEVHSTSSLKSALNIEDKTEIMNIGYVYANQLLALGLPVLVETVQSKDAIDWSKLTDKGLYDVKYLTAGGLELPLTSENSTATNTIEKMLAAAAKRGDCIALIDHSQIIEPNKGESYAEAVRRNLGLNHSDSEVGALYANANLKYAAAFTPWCKFSFSSGALPPSFAYLSAYASSVAANPNWYAAAGKYRGVIPQITSVLHSYGDAECNSLQARSITDDGDFSSDDNKGIAINPITYIRAFGSYVVWGNRTLLNGSTAGGLTASSFLNVRNLCCDVKKELYSAAREFTFEQNGDILWVNFSARIKPLLDKALSGNGIKGYKLIKEETNKKGRLKARIRIVAIEAVEDFDLTLEMTDNIESVEESI